MEFILEPKEYGGAFPSIRCARVVNYVEIPIALQINRENMLSVLMHQCALFHSNRGAEASYNFLDRRFDVRILKKISDLRTLEIYKEHNKWI